MGRELKRVPLDFDWPLKKRWDGYLNPYWKHHCPEKDKTCVMGNTAGKAWLEAILRLLLLAADDAECPEEYRKDRTWPHPYLQKMATAPQTQGEHDKETRCWTRLPTLIPPTPDIAEIVQGLAGREGCSSSNLWAVSRRIISAAGLTEDWGVCPVCGGHAVHPDYLERYEAWEPTEPPEGEGYQLWETTSEGSPASPVFESLDKLCAWCEKNATTFASFTTTKEKWKEMLTTGNVHHREGHMIFV